MRKEVALEEIVKILCMPLPKHEIYFEKRLAELFRLLQDVDAFYHSIGGLDPSEMPLGSVMSKKDLSDNHIILYGLENEQAKIGQAISETLEGLDLVRHVWALATSRISPKHFTLIQGKIINRRLTEDDIDRLVADEQMEMILAVIKAALSADLPMLL